MSVSSKFNPYEPPLETEIAGDVSPANQWRQVIQQFRMEARAIAGVSFFLAVCTGMVCTEMVASVFLSAGQELKVIVAAGIGFTAAIAFSVAGVQIAMKKMIGVRVLLFLVYASLLIALLMIPVTFGFIIPVAVALGLTAAQCHRVLKNARRLESSVDASHQHQELVRK